MIRLLFVLGLLMAFVPPHVAAAQRNCKKGIPCGNSCIAANRVCRVGPRAPVDPPAPPTTSKALKLLTAADSAALIKVWVNKKSRVYHCPGSRYYGTTSAGAFMLEREAIAVGYRGAYKRVCGA
ncbi:hypothetical protein [Gemmatimonas sp.]|uniref:hypothetical protein n=1 Tax=Gemmatimonas sp. TaxID=1962908 RepID=UPI00286DA189|nr:hypothetical protein [Gemmatimonas sp.]